MAIIVRTALTPLQVAQVASAMDRNGIRIVAILPPTAGAVNEPIWEVFGQSTIIDYARVDATIDRIIEGKEEL